MNKVASLLATLLLTLLLSLAWLMSPSVGALYLTAFKGYESDLPLLTAAFALPFLRPEAVDALNPAHTPWWVILAWLTLFILPWVLLIWTWKSPNPNEFITRWVMGASVYSLLVVGLLALVLTGLIMPLVHI